MTAGRSSASPGPRRPARRDRTRRRAGRPQRPAGPGRGRAPRWGWRSALSRRLAQQRPGDDQALDLARALVDLGDLGVAVVALGGELAGVAIAAEHLDRLARPVAGHARGEE